MYIKFYIQFLGLATLQEGLNSTQAGGHLREQCSFKISQAQGIPGCLSSLVPAFGPGLGTGVPGSSPGIGLPAWSLLLPLPVSLCLS